LEEGAFPPFPPLPPLPPLPPPLTMSILISFERKMSNSPRAVPSRYLASFSYLEGTFVDCREDVWEVRFFAAAVGWV
jgi:hypothetical protein